ncbi:hypothetical protein CPB86DRAFT_174935 [Serendipita vermifera]|nr:hypothetical protein CPB86DRAFT_174935 [Serendipita vermifera]
MLHKMIRTLHRRPLRGRSSPEQAQSTTPGLPLEVWWAILEISLCSSPAALEYFAPCEILLAHDYFLRNWDTQSVAQSHAVTLKRNLRQVCKSWRHIVDNIDIDYHQIQVYKYTNGRGQYATNEQPITMNTRLYTMLTFETVTSLVHLIPVKYRYTHPISAMKMQTIPSVYHNAFANIESLSDIVSFPGQLKVLNLYMDACKGPMDLLKGIQEISIPLTTLSLLVTRPLLLQTCLTIPTLDSLFASIPSSQRERIWTDPSRYQWSLPNLRNLSLVERDLDGSRPAFGVPSTHPFYVELLKHNMLNLRSLLVFPITIQVYDQSSPLCWTNMPKLQVLATNFSRHVATFRLGAHLSRTSKSNSVRHLVQFDRGWLSSEMGLELCRCIGMCTQLESITIVDRGSAVDWMTVRPCKEMVKFRDLCNERGITIWSQWDSLSPREIVDTMAARKR